MRLQLKKKRDKTPQKTEKCAYIKCCYLAEALECYGYKSDCILYLKSNNCFFTRKAFDEAVNRLIDRSKVRHEQLHAEPQSVKP